MKERAVPATTRLATIQSASRGSALLAALLVASALSLVTAVAVTRARDFAAEAGARRDAACARFAAVSGLRIGPSALDPQALAALIGPDVTSVSVSYQSLSGSWCVIRAQAQCRSAHRTLERLAPLAGCP